MAFQTILDMNMQVKMLRKHEPVSEEQMKWVSHHNTICETIRRIYEKSTDPDVRLKCREATAMAKAMSRKLTEYKDGWNNGFFDDNSQFPEIFLKARSKAKTKCVQIVTDMEFQWLDGYRKVFTHNGWTVKVIDRPTLDPTVSVWLLMWLNEDAKRFASKHPKLPKIQFIRRYDYYTDLVESMPWGNVNKIVMLNDFFASGFKEKTGIEPLVIRNGVSPEKWGYRERSHGTKIALVGYLNMKKSIPIALQVLYALPKEYTLHIAGRTQQREVLDYMVHHSGGALENRIVWYEQIEHDRMDEWLDDKDYLLSTAISEGCPNNVIEAMAKGIKPVVHNWPGAEEQFGDYVFNSIDEAVEMIIPDSHYDSSAYRNDIIQNYGDGPFKQVFDLTMEIADV